MKEDRIEMLQVCINKISEVMQLYMTGSVGHTLLKSSFSHVNSLHHLESKSPFDEKTLGVLIEDNNINRTL